MRKILAILMIFAMLFLSACQSQGEVPQATGTTVQSTVSTTQDETERETEPVTTTDQTVSSSQPVITEPSSTETEGSTETVIEEEKKQPETKPSETSQVQQEQEETKDPVETKPTETTPTENSTQETVDTGKINEPVPTDPVVLRADPVDVEQLVAQYLNQHRNDVGASSATVLPGLTTVARYRSEQLITSFTHANSATVCTALQYGQFIDMTQYGMSESDSYYQGYNREALAKGNWGGTAEEIAAKIANGLRNSPNHWKYLSSSEYGYMAVGCTYSEVTNMWYCCVCLSAENYGG